MSIYDLVFSSSPQLQRLISMCSLLLLLLCANSTAQTLPRDRVVSPIEMNATVTIHKSVSPLVGKSADVGRLPGDRHLGQMLLMLSPAKEQDAALKALIKELHTPSSAKYHHWLKPEEIGTRFGVSERDTAAVQQWLLSQGFEIKRVASSRRFVSFAGTVHQVESAFHTEMHEYDLHGQKFIANSTETQIPAALSPVVRGVVRLSSTPKDSNIKIAGQAAYDKTRQQITFSNGDHAITPADFAIIYNLNPLYQQGINGSGQSIAIVARSDIYSRDVFDFMSVFGVSIPGFYYIVNGDDPGIVPPSDVEATLDVTWAAALAPGAITDFVVSQSNFADGVDISAAYIVDNDLAPVMSTSFGACEQAMGPVGTSFYYWLWAQAAAEGITSIVASGDNGGAGCDNPGSGQFAQNGFAVSGLASTPYNVAVGGTQFDDTANPSQYWSQSNDPTTKASVLSYIPEQVWNQSSVDPYNVNLYASAGGVSTLWTKPDWQIGTGVPNDGMRDLPDVSLNAASHDGYVLCYGFSCENGSVYIVAGTSASAPAFAAVMALVNQVTGSPQGNPNYVLYQLAAQHPEIFHDITVGDNKVPDPNGQFTIGYPAGPGYDLATGLGSFDANALVMNWNTVQFSGTSTTLTGPPSGTTFVHGAGVPVTAAVAAKGVIPTGNVAFSTDNPYNVTPVPPGLAVGVARLDATGTANTSLVAIPGGTHTVTARYAGDAKFSASTSNSVTVTVTPESSNTQFVGAVGGSIVTSVTIKYDEIATVGVLVQGNSGVGYPSGSVTVSEGPNAIGSRVLNFGEHENSQQGSSSVFGIYGFPVGLHLLQASYAGDASFNPSTSSNLQFTVTKSDSRISFGLQGATVANVPVPIFGRVALPSGAPLPVTGRVAITASSGSTSLNIGTAAVDPNSGTFSTSATFPASGGWVLTAVYSGDANVNGSQTQQQVTVDSTESTTITLASNPPTSPAGGTVTFTAQVASNVTLRVPTGSMTFADGATSLGTATLDNYGIATLFTTSLTGGVHSISATYSGDAVFRSSSATLNESISDYALQLVTAIQIKVGQSGSASFGIVPEGGFTQPVSFACSGLPSGANCSFAPQTVTPDGVDIATDTMTISTSGAAALPLKRAAMTPMRRFGGSIVALVGAFFVLPWGKRRKQVRQAAFSGALLLLLMFGLGCGGSSAPPPNPMIGTYKVTVTATATGGASHTANMSVTITQ